MEDLLAELSNSYLSELQPSTQSEVGTAHPPHPYWKQLFRCLGIVCRDTSHCSPALQEARFPLFHFVPLCRILTSFDYMSQHFTGLEEMDCVDLLSHAMNSLLPAGVSRLNGATLNSNCKFGKLRCSSTSVSSHTAPSSSLQRLDRPPNDRSNNRTTTSMSFQTQEFWLEAARLASLQRSTPLQLHSPFSSGLDVSINLPTTISFHSLYPLSSSGFPSDRLMVLSWISLSRHSFHPNKDASRWQSFLSLLSLLVTSTLSISHPEYRSIVISLVI